MTNINNNNVNISNSGICDNSDNKNVIINTGNTYNIHIDRYNLVNGDGEFLTRQYSENADLFMLNTLQSKFEGQRFLKNPGNNDGILPLDNLPRTFKFGPSNSLIKNVLQNPFPPYPIPIPIPPAQKMTHESHPQNPSSPPANNLPNHFFKSNLSSKCIDRLFNQGLTESNTTKKNLKDIEKTLKDFVSDSNPALPTQPSKVLKNLEILNTKFEGPIGLEGQNLIGVGGRVTGAPGGKVGGRLGKGEFKGRKELGVIGRDNCGEERGFCNWGVRNDELSPWKGDKVPPTDESFGF
jgi:hypothetical protein